MAGGLNLYGYADGDPVNKSDPFGLCPYCEGVVQALSQLAPSIQRTLEVGAVAVMAPFVVVAAAEVAATVGVQQVASNVTTTLVRTAARAEGQAARSGTLSFAAGVAEGAGRAFMSDQGHKTLPQAGPPPNAAWGAGRAVGTGLYYGMKLTAAHYGVTW